MAWRRPGDKPLSEAMMVSLLTENGRGAEQKKNLNFRRGYPEEK